jgi:hypothetical protein
MGFAWMPEDSRHASGDGDMEDGPSWPYHPGGDRGHAVIPQQRSPFRRGSLSGRSPASAGLRAGRHAQSKGRRAALARFAVTRLQSLSRRRGLRDASDGPAAEAGLRHQPERRMAGRGAHAASWPAAPPR